MKKRLILLVLAALVIAVPFLTFETPKVEAANSFAGGLAGKLLLDVDQGGEIWYVDTVDYNRHSVTWDNALPLFESFALGITDDDLLKIPAKTSSLSPFLDSDGDGYSDITELNNGYNPYSRQATRLSYDSSLANRLKGKLLLQVNRGGAIWYVDMNGYRHNVRWDNLLPLFQSLALGITHSDLARIDGEQTWKTYTNSQNSFSIDYPSNLTVRERRAGDIAEFIVGFIEPGAQDNLVSVEKYTNLSDFSGMSAVKEYYKVNDGYIVLFGHDTDLANQIIDSFEINNSWKTYTNSQNSFSIDYPSNLTVRERRAGDIAEFIVGFIEPGAQDNLVSVEKYTNLSDFSGMSAVKEYYKVNDGYIVLFGHDTDLANQIVATFQLR